MFEDERELAPSRTQKTNPQHSNVRRDCLLALVFFSVFLRFPAFQQFLYYILLKYILS